ncbi:unnamed protein product [Vicia faba]|uniref:DUS-like FMN-binding domain-containing protein n=1 Tax=Vicia faba TaxID=3906 RepID=A0AAV1AQR4_VICFA|nr:unnamed protein product [Vicia faba]
MEFVKVKGVIGKGAAEASVKHLPPSALGDASNFGAMGLLAKSKGVPMEALFKQVQDGIPWFSVAPMMDWTNNHYRTLERLISKHAWLYTKMLAAETIVHQKDNLDRFLAYSPKQHLIVLQIAGSSVESLAK